MVEASDTAEPVRVVGRYALYGEIAAGGMATVHFGRLLGPVGFSRTVAIKRLHPQFAKDPEFVSMFLDEARLAARIRHPNVVPTLDVVATQGELFLVMDYVQGESLSRLTRVCRERAERIPTRFVGTIMSGALHGLHAAHEAKNERGEPLHIVHRDISPQNVLVGTDGVARVLDFGVAKAAGRVQTTREGQLKGKLTYMAPEQINGKVSRQTDIYAAAIILWEALTGQRLFQGENEGQILAKVLGGLLQPPSSVVPDLPTAFDEVVMRGLASAPADRYATAREFAMAVERCLGVASPAEVGEWVESIAHGALLERAEKIAEIESSSSSNVSPNLDLGNKTEITKVPTPTGSNPADSPVSQASQLSSISVSSSAVSARSRLGVVAGVVVAALAGAAIAFTVAARTRATQASSPLARDPPAASDATSVAAPVSATPPLTTAPSVPATPPNTASATGTAAASDQPLVHAAPGHHMAAPAITSATPPPAKNCDPPYALDAKGHKIWKRECM
ncbi:MAG TPA: protein kinase [Polyangiaceae bacterium]|nr:protein kinase [Polyangiaceae bacterium]